MIRATGKVLSEKTADCKDRHQSSGVADDREKKRSRKKHHLFPQSILTEMAIDRGEHRNRHKRANPAAAFIYFEFECIVCGLDDGADALDVNTNEVADCARDSSLNELQLCRGLNEKIQRHHKQQERDWKKQYPRDRDSPDV